MIYTVFEKFYKNIYSFYFLEYTNLSIVSRTWRRILCENSSFIEFHPNTPLHVFTNVLSYRKAMQKKYDMVWIERCLVLDDELLSEIMSSIVSKDIELIGENSLRILPRNAVVMRDDGNSGNSGGNGNGNSGGNSGGNSVGGGGVAPLVIMFDCWKLWNVNNITGLSPKSVVYIQINTLRSTKEERTAKAKFLSFCVKNGRFMWKKLKEMKIKCFWVLKKPENSTVSVSVNKKFKIEFFMVKRGTQRTGIKWFNKGIAVYENQILLYRKN